MGKKKDKEKKEKKLKEKAIKQIQDTGGPIKCKTKCCKKYKKSEAKRCKKCPCFDLLKKVA